MGGLKRCTLHGWTLTKCNDDRLQWRSVPLYFYILIKNLEADKNLMKRYSNCNLKCSTLFTIKTFEITQKGVERYRN